MTEKELEVLKLRRANCTQKEVASRLSISQAAVSCFEKNAIRKVKEAEQTLSVAKQLKIKSISSVKSAYIFKGEKNE